MTDRRCPIVWRSGLDRDAPAQGDLGRRSEDSTDLTVERGKTGKPSRPSAWTQIWPLVVMIAVLEAIFVPIAVYAHPGWWFVILEAVLSFPAGLAVGTWAVRR